MKRGIKLLLFVVYLVFGLYMINSVFVFTDVPGFLSDIDNAASIISGLLLVVASFLILKIRRLKSTF